MLRTRLFMLLSWLGGCSMTAPDNTDHWATAGACPAAPVIGVLDGAGSCDLGGHLPPGWQARVMFSEGSPEVAALELPPPPALARFCSYEWQGNRFPDDLAALRAAIQAYPHMQIETASPDCHLPLPRGAELERAVELARRDAFRLDIDWVDGAILEASADRAPIEIAVADTISAEVGATGRTPVHIHGQVVGAIIADIACPERHPNCVANVRHTLAMPRRDGHSAPDWVEGGVRGTRGDVALAIYAAVEGWRERWLDNPAAPARLVLNLSLGWEPAPPELAPSQALQAALRFASCNGVLIFASAGNDTRGRSNRNGPLEPARFETVPAPNAAECQALGFVPLAEHEYPVFDENQKPLVWAVGGVDANDQPLLDARSESMPRLVSPALDGLAMAANGELTRALTGSSIAAAVASGTAALIWSYRPELRPDQIVDIIYHSGWDTHQVAHFGLEGQRTIHRVSVCAALARTCDDDSRRTCPKLDCAARAPANHEHRSALAEALRRLHDDPSTSIRVHPHR
jgi:hypothetical protein